MQASLRYGRAVRTLANNLADKRLHYSKGNEAAGFLLYCYEVRPTSCENAVNQV